MSIRRREFLTAAAAANFMILKPALVRGSERNSAVRLGLLGCGGRGTGVAQSFIENTGAQLAGLGDLFEDQLTKAKAKLDGVAVKKGKPGVDAALLFHGPDAAERMMGAKGLDAVYIATPPYFHPDHLEMAARAGRHVYVEKPVGVDVASAERVRHIGEDVNGKLSLAVGFQLRHATPYMEMVRRIREGALGSIVCGLTYYFAGSIPRPEWPNASPVERRLRNWIFDRTLSGDIIVEQNIHVIDLTNWVMGAHPLLASGTGGRAGRADKGNCFSHYNCTFTYPNDVHITMNSTQFIKGSWDVEMRYFGTKGNAEANYSRPVRITGEEPWTFPGLGPAGEVRDSAAAATGAFKGALEDADANKERAFIESITSGNYLNQAATGADSALSAMLGRMAAYTWIMHTASTPNTGRARLMSPSVE